MYPSAIFHQLGSGVTIAILTLLLTLLLIKSWMENRCLLPLPPGPALNRFPIFGYLPFLGGNRPVHDIFVDFAKKYGRIFHVRLGNKMMVVISCPQLLKEVYKREDITDRPHSPLVDGVMDGYGEKTISLIKQQSIRIGYSL